MRSQISLCSVSSLCLILVTGPVLRATAAPTSTAVSQAASNKTPVKVRLEMDLRSGRDKVGELVIFSVDQDVYGPNHTLLLRKGDIARGHVTTSANPGSVEQPGKLTFTCDYALADDGRRVPLLLSVTPSPGNPYDETNGDGSLGELPASTGAETALDGVDPGRVGDPSGYVQSAVPGSYFQQFGSVSRFVFDPQRLFGDGTDVIVDRGQEYEAFLSPKALRPKVNY